MLFVFKNTPTRKVVRIKNHANNYNNTNHAKN